MAKIPTPPGVRFKLIPGFTGYGVAEDGSVWSRYRPNGYGGGWSLSDRWVRRKGHPNKDGHLVYLLAKNGVPIHRFGHQLVMAAFVGPCPKGMECCHDPDPNPANNHLSNLRWATPKENSSDCIRHGRRPRGSEHGRAKLRDADIPIIKKLVECGVPKARVGKCYGVTGTTVRRICNGQIWRHLWIA